MPPRQLVGTEILDKRGAQVPLDVNLTNQEGKKVTLGKYLNGTNPVILTLGYYQCPMLCNLVLNGLLTSLKKISLRPGRDFTVVSVSINPKEGVDLAKHKRLNYLKALGWTEEAEWYFHVGDEKEVRRLADAIGFQYRFDPREGEYVHSAGVFILSPTGVVSRVFYGIAYPPQDLKLALVDAGNGKVGSLLDRVILSCFHYDPDSHKYGVYVMGVMRVGGLLTIVIILAMLIFYWRGERRSRR